MSVDPNSRDPFLCGEGIDGDDFVSHQLAGTEEGCFLQKNRKRNRIRILIPLVNQYSGALYRFEPNFNEIFYE